MQDKPIFVLFDAQKRNEPAQGQPVVPVVVCAHSLGQKQGRRDRYPASPSQLARRSRSVCQGCHGGRGLQATAASKRLRWMCQTYRVQPSP